MNRDYKFYKNWQLKWVRIFRRIIDKYPLSNRKAQMLIAKIKDHFWILERRALAYMWFDENPEKSFIWADF